MEHLFNGVSQVYSSVREARSKDVIGSVFDNIEVSLEKKSLVLSDSDWAYIISASTRNIPYFSEVCSSADIELKLTFSTYEEAATAIEEANDLEQLFLIMSEFECNLIKGNLVLPLPQWDQLGELAKSKITSIVNPTKAKLAREKFEEIIIAKIKEQDFSVITPKVLARLDGKFNWLRDELLEARSQVKDEDRLEFLNLVAEVKNEARNLGFKFLH